MEAYVSVTLPESAFVGVICFQLLAAESAVSYLYDRFLRA